MSDDDLDEYGNDEDPAVSALVGVYKSAQEAMKSELDRLRKENAALRDLLASCLAHGSFPQGSGILHAIRAALQGAKDD